MNKAELKAVLKPLIKECIKEAIFEEGVLSGIITEVAQGLTAQAPLVENKKPAPAKAAPPTPRRSAQSERARSELIESINKDAYNGVNIFEGVEPMASGGKTSSEPQPGSPLGDVAPNDPGVNIDGILNIAGDAWGKFI
tara:strand:- start:249 stop:665 length:417 start_codon:yes stop_codon:yes gene_type:complete